MDVYEDDRDGYAKEIVESEESDIDEDEERLRKQRKSVRKYTADESYFAEYQEQDGEDTIMERQSARQIADRESDYHKRKFNRAVDDVRRDPFHRDTVNGPDQGMNGPGYADVMKQHDFEVEEQRVLWKIEEQKRLMALGGKQEEREGKPEHKRRWDVGPEGKDDAEVPVKRSRWDEAPAAAPKRPSRWDAGPQEDEAPKGDHSMATPTRAGADLSLVSRPLSDADLDSLLPSKGFTILEAPPDYVPIRTHAQKSNAPPTASAGFTMQEPVEDGVRSAQELPSEIPGVGDLAYFKAEDMKYFGKLVDGRDDQKLSMDELKEKKIMRLLLKVKNGTPPQRKSSLRELTDSARQLGAGPLFNQILPLLMERTLEDQERHLLVKIIDRILYKLDELVRPYVHKILVVIEPLLIDEDYYARIEGREIISNLAKAAGLAHMITTMRPDIDRPDEYVRNTTARAFSVVASALGVPALLPFLKAVCRSKKSWQARHTGVRIIQQIAILMGPAILPHLKTLVDCVGKNLEDEQTKVRIMTGLALASLAEAAAPYGFESFDSVILPLWTGVRSHRGKTLAAFFKAVGFIIPLMDEESANYYTDEIMKVLKRNFDSPDEEMKKIVLKVIKQCCASAGVTSQYLKTNLLDDYFDSFWVRRMASDRRNYREVLETTVEIANKVGVGEIAWRLVDNLKDDNEQFRRMSVDTLEKIMSNLGVADVDERLEERLIDGMMFSFQEQTTDDKIMLNGFGTLLAALGTRTKPYFPQIVSMILWRLNNKDPLVRQQSADLISRVALVMKACEEDELMGKLGIVLYEYLGEEYPEVLGSILGALRAVVSVVGMAQMQPPIQDLLPRLTPILRNRHEKVQENTIDLVGKIADRGSEFISAREWMRICFELLDTLRAQKKGIRRAAVNTFGYIAKAIGPQDVLAALLNNLRVQERQSRVCTCVAIAIVAETCEPFTIVPALMNEYRMPEINVQNGVLKSMAFVFEYIGDMARDYIYAVTPLLEDAMVDRDQVHRQTGADVIKHIALGCVGRGSEDALIHFLNLLWPNIFETSPHVIDRIVGAIDAIRTAVGPGIVLNYVWAGLFHPARRVREIYWRLYNDAYVQQADAMVPCYPVMQGKAHRNILDVCI